MSISARLSFLDKDHPYSYEDAQQELTDVSVCGIGMHGNRQVIIPVVSLLPRGKETLVLPLEKVIKFSGLMVTTEQRVGEVVYFERYLEDPQGDS